MRAVIAERAGGPEVLTVVERAEPEPGPGEVVVRAEAIGVNFADVWARLGAGGDPPYSPGIEVVGAVVAVAAGVTWPAVGDRVAGTPYETAGAYAEYVRVPAARAYPVPATMDAVTAAVLPINYLTAYAAVQHAARPRLGERVLVHAAGGGVGLASVQIARRLGAEIYGTASAAKHDALRDEGVSHVIDYRTVDWVAEIGRLTGDGVDIVIDGVGEDRYRRSLSATRYGGRVVAYGYTAGVSGPTEATLDLEADLAGGPSVWDLLSEARGLIGVGLDGPPDRLHEWWEHLLAWHAAGEIRPRLDRVLPLADAAEAHRRLHARANLGKIVLVT